MKIFFTGNFVYLFRKDKEVIVCALILKDGKDLDNLKYDLYIKQGENEVLKDVPVEEIFETYDDCLENALKKYKEKINLNTCDYLRASPISQRYGDLDPLTELIDDYLRGKKDLVGIQIGSYQGEGTELFLKSGAFKTLYCIDPWESGYDQRDQSADDRIFAAEQKFDKRFANNYIVKKIKAKSNDVVTKFEDESLDFIYVDGCHTYESVKDDLNNYIPKVKKGGIIAGHDWCQNWPGVSKAVMQVFHKEPIKKYLDSSWVYIKE